MTKRAEVKAVRPPVFIRYCSVLGCCKVCRPEPRRADHHRRQCQATDGLLQCVPAASLDRLPAWTHALNPQFGNPSKHVLASIRPEMHRSSSKQGSITVPGWRDTAHDGIRFNRSKAPEAGWLLAAQQVAYPTQAVTSGNGLATRLSSAQTTQRAPIRYGGIRVRASSTDRASGRTFALALRAAFPHRGLRIGFPATIDDPDLSLTSQGRSTLRPFPRIPPRV